MLGKTHLGGGILTSLLLCNGDIVSSVWLIIGSILPDVDHPGSMIGKNVPLLPKLLRHRGFTHSILFSILISLFNVWLGIGSLVHIVMDMMTKQGVELFYPNKAKIRFPLAKKAITNGIFEKVIFYGCYLLITYLLYVRFV
jgi:inner membrane protein